ncbi:hypothetical protein SAMN02910413_1042 [Pseudobutyrivibrio sp. C4]|uniref:hypothetical protein n=1 Tax=Pseudobutyrivibrio sp. C4 TaxID=1520803 RepID=UPI0008D525DA|nr:hypothetical protein [Pseudobutyrivibrio sp. C4]SES87358.1 hypothetical protein SAMN02910413_1042 [Pseudobutyrivibrio sp. C4]
MMKKIKLLIIMMMVICFLVACGTGDVASTGTYRLHSDVDYPSVEVYDSYIVFYEDANTSYTYDDYKQNDDGTYSYEISDHWKLICTFKGEDTVKVKLAKRDKSIATNLEKLQYKDLGGTYKRR